MGGKKGEEALFTCRESVVQYLDLMPRHKFFHRAKKIPVTEQELKARSKKRDRKRDERKINRKRKIIKNRTKQTAVTPKKKPKRKRKRRTRKKGARSASTCI